MLPPDLAQVVEQYHRALEAYVAGEADPVMRLFSRRDDVTLANPLGPPVRGWDRVDEAARRTGAQVREGEDNRFERISEFLAQIESSVEEARDIHLIQIPRTIAGLFRDLLLPVFLRVGANAIGKQAYTYEPPTLKKIPAEHP